jgi:hypothetical protein
VRGGSTYIMFLAVVLESGWDEPSKLSSKMLRGGFSFGGTNATLRSWSAILRTEEMATERMSSGQIVDAGVVVG